MNFIYILKKKNLIYGKNNIKVQVKNLGITLLE
jgi:hypothetical protein